VCQAIDGPRDDDIFFFFFLLDNDSTTPPYLAVAGAAHRLVSQLVSLR
jgi:hypothetical protein